MKIEKNLPHQYSLLQISYWMLYCVGYSYVTLYLLHQDFTAGNIGIITAVFGTMAALIQPILGSIADKNPRLGWKPQAFVLFSIAMICMIGLLTFRIKLAQGIIYGIFLMVLSCLLPLINAANFYYESRKIPMKFGLSRGLGSLFYAFLSLIIGKATADGNVSVIAAFGLIISIGCIFVTLSFPYGKKIDLLENQSDKSNYKTEKIAYENDNSLGNNSSGSIDNRVNSDSNIHQQSFIKRYPLFCLTLPGFVLCLIFHNIANTYLLQMMEAVGGNSSDYGTAIALSAVLELPAMFGFVYLYKKFSMHTLLSVCGVAFALKSISYLIATNVAMMYTTQIFQAFAFALFIPASVYFSQKYMRPEDMVKGQSMISCSITVAAVLGNFIGGQWLDAFGIKSMEIMTVVSAFAGAIIIIIVTKKMEHSM